MMHTASIKRGACGARVRIKMHGRRNVLLRRQMPELVECVCLQCGAKWFVKVQKDGSLYRTDGSKKFREWRRCPNRCNAKQTARTPKGEA